MDALDVETNIAEGEQRSRPAAVCQGICREPRAHEAEKGIFKRLLPIGLAAMKLYFAQRGTGDDGPPSRGPTAYSCRGEAAARA